MLKYNRSIKALTDLQGRVYLYLPDSVIREQFESDAMAEGVTYPDGVPLPERELDSIMALNQNMTVNFVGMYGRMHFHQVSSEPEIRPQPLIRVDYERYAAGCEDYIIQYKMVKQQNYLSDAIYR